LDVSVFAAQAAAWIPPHGSAKSPGAISFGSRPPINLEAIDPELASLELNLGDPSSAVTILEALEMWERSIREDRGFGAYGPASAARLVAGTGTLTAATLAGVVGFLASQIEWITTEPAFGLEEFADHIRRTVNILRRWDESSVQVGTRINCPGMVEDKTCNAPIRISTEGEPVFCRKCGHSWTIDWLIAVAGADADGWADIEAVSRLSGLHERTIRRWASSGKVRKRGLLYNVRDIGQATTREAS